MVYLEVQFFNKVHFLLLCELFLSTIFFNFSCLFFEGGFLRKKNKDFMSQLTSESAILDDLEG